MRSGVQLVTTQCATNDRPSSSRSVRNSDPCGAQNRSAETSFPSDAPCATSRMRLMPGLGVARALASFARRGGIGCHSYLQTHSIGKLIASPLRRRGRSAPPGWTSPAAAGRTSRRYHPADIPRQKLSSTSAGSLSKPTSKPSSSVKTRQTRDPEREQQRRRPQQTRHRRLAFKAPEVGSRRIAECNCEMASSSPSPLPTQ